MSSEEPLNTDPETATAALIAGPLVKVASEIGTRENCLRMLSKPSSDAPVGRLIKHQDRGGLIYLSDKLFNFVLALRRCLDVILGRMRVEHSLTEAVKMHSKSGGPASLLQDVSCGSHSGALPESPDLFIICDAPGISWGGSS